MANPEFTDIYDEIRDAKERRHSENDDEYSINAFIAAMATEALRLVDKDAYDQRSALVRAAAMAVTAIEQIDRRRARHR